MFNVVIFLSHIITFLYDEPITFTKYGSILPPKKIIEARTIFIELMEFKFIINGKCFVLLHFYFHPTLFFLLFISS